MEVTTVQWVEKLFYKKIMLYSDLLDCLQAERDALIRIDLDKLWQVSKEKDEICLQISNIRQEIMAAIFSNQDQASFDFNRILAKLPVEAKSNFQKLHLRLIKLKGEIDIIRKENVIYINDSLQFLDEIMSIITGKDQSRMVYDAKCHYRKSSPYCFLSREV